MVITLRTHVDWWPGPGGRSPPRRASTTGPAHHRRPRPAGRRRWVAERERALIDAGLRAGARAAAAALGYRCRQRDGPSMPGHPRPPRAAAGRPERLASRPGHTRRTRVRPGLDQLPRIATARLVRD